MSRQLRVLHEPDTPALLNLLGRNPVENIFLWSRVAHLGVERSRLGCPILGFERDGDLVAVCHAGSNLVPVGDDPEALAAFASKLGPMRISQSIMGPASAVLGLYDELTRRWKAWRDIREIRARQPLMVIDTEPALAADPRIRIITAGEFRPYFDAAVKMYTEEVGVSPLDASGSYQSYVRMLIDSQRAFGGVHRGRVWFKSDIGSAVDKYCQVQGVWLHPKLRGKGLSEPAMAQVVRLCQRQFPVVSLYVNDFNIRARRLYERVGFRTVTDFATVLY